VRYSRRDGLSSVRIRCVRVDSLLQAEIKDGVAKQSVSKGIFRVEAMLRTRPGWFREVAMGNRRGMRQHVRGRNLPFFCSARTHC